MRLICPNCVAQYEVDESVIPEDGREVQCANCGHKWFQDRVLMFSSGIESPIPTGDQDTSEKDDASQDTSDTEAAETEPQEINEIESNESQDDFGIERTVNAPSSRLGRAALDVLHSEAEYSSGEKPPAAAEEEPAEDTRDAGIEEISDDTADDDADHPAEIAEDTEEAAEETIETAPDEPTDEISETDVEESVDEATNESLAESAEDTQQDTDKVDSDATVQDASTSDDHEETAMDEPAGVSEEPIGSDQPDETPPTSPEDPGIEEIRKRIQGLEYVETTDAEEPASDPTDVKEIDAVKPPRPFSRPVSRTIRKQPRPTPHQMRQYEENMPSEKPSPADTVQQDQTAKDIVSEPTNPEPDAVSVDDVSTALDPQNDKPVEDTIQSLIAEQDDVSKDDIATSSDRDGKESVEDAIEALISDQHTAPQQSQEKAIADDVDNILADHDDLPLADISAALDKKNDSVDESVEVAIDALIAEQSEAEAAAAKPARKSLASMLGFSRGKKKDDEDAEEGGAYEPLNQRHQDTQNDNDQHSDETDDGSEDAEAGTTGAVGGFLRGFKYAVIISLLVGALYFLKPIIVELVPQAEGVMNIITDVVDTIARLIVYLINLIRGLIG